MTCDEAGELLPELALGILDGRQRAAAQAHVASCGPCRAELRRHSEVVDDLVTSVPGAEPPAGFEGRALARIAQSAGSPPLATPRRARSVAGRPAAGRRRRPLQLAAAVAAVAAVTGLVGYRLGDHRTPSPLRQATLTSAGRPVGSVYFFAGAHPWVYMAVTMPAAGGTITCQLENGSRVLATVGSFQLYNGHGGWGAPAPVTAAVTGARLVDATGAVLAEASFPG